jgi:hypothetical protein
MKAESGHNYLSRMRRIGAELFTVIAGILLALAVNEAWNDHNDKSRGEDELNGVREELARSQQLLGRLVLWDSLSLAANGEMLEIVAEGSSPDVVIPSNTFAYFRSTATYDPPMGRIQSLISTGNLRLIRDTRLRAGLASWPGQVEAAKEHHDRMRDFWAEAIAPYLRTYGSAPDVWGLNADSIISLHRSTALAGLLYQRRFHARDVQKADSTLSSRLNTLVGVLDSAADKRKR